MHAADDGIIGGRAVEGSAPAGDTDGAAGTAAPRLLEVVRERVRYRHFSYRTEQANVGWVRRVPAQGEVALNPMIISGGVGYRF